MHTRRRVAQSAALTAVVLVMVAGLACGRKKPPVQRPAPPPPPPPAATAGRPPGPPEPVAEPTVVPPEPVKEEGISASNLDELNKNSPFKPVFFEYDSAEITTTGQAALDEDAALLKKNPKWNITIEGHCDERGTAEYNLALGERRAVAARTYLVSLGIPADRLRTVSYGKEFPFDPGHEENAWAKNRRAHFVVTSMK
jgi:peptidoglycan-associated lipoprotein